MNPLIALIVVELVKQLPALAVDLIEVLSKGGTPEDFADLKRRWSKPIADYYKEAEDRLNQPPSTPSPANG